MRYASWFDGISGFKLAMDAAGHKCVFSCEIDDFCERVHVARYGRKFSAKDITKVRAKDVPDADIYIAGWPCQGLSNAGRRKGLADERSGLFWEFVRLLEQKRPAGFLAENVPGLLTTCSCSLCGKKCKACGTPAGGEDEACSECGSEDLGGKVLPEHRGTDFFVVLTALQRIGYGVQTRILDAQFFGVPQRRRRVYLVGCLGAPCRPEILFEPQGGFGDLAESQQAGSSTAGDPAAVAGGAGASRRIASGELARSVGGVGGGQDFGANKGTLVGPKDASSVTASAGHHGHSSPRGDGCDNIVAGTLQSCSGRQGRKTPENDQLVAPTVTSRQHKGGFTDPVNDGIVVIHPPVAFQQSQSGIRTSDSHPTLDANNGSRRMNGVLQPMAYNSELGLAPHGSMKGSGAVPTLTGTEYKGKTLVQHQLFIDAYACRGSSSPNQSPVKSDGKSDALDTTGPGEVAVLRIGNTSTDPMVRTPHVTDSLTRGTGHGCGAADQAVAYGISNHGDQAVGENIMPPVEAKVGGGGRMDVVAAPAVAVRRLTPSECERLQGTPDGWTCTCGVRPDCPDRRIPPWVDPKTFKLQGCGHSACGCKCSDSSRYKSLGNSVAICAVRWIVDRITAAFERSEKR